MTEKTNKSMKNDFVIKGKKLLFQGPFEKLSVEHFRIVRI